MGTKWVKLTEFQSYVRILVVYVCESLLQLAVELSDLSQAETKIIAVKSWSNSQNDNYFHKKWRLFSTLAILSLKSSFVQLEINHVIQQPTEAD